TPTRICREPSMTYSQSGESVPVAGLVMKTKKRREVEYKEKTNSMRRAVPAGLDFLLKSHTISANTPMMIKEISVVSAKDPHAVRLIRVSENADSSPTVRFAVALRTSKFNTARMKENTWWINSKISAPLITLISNCADSGFCESAGLSSFVGGVGAAW